MDCTGPWGPRLSQLCPGGHRHHTAGAAGRMKKGRKTKVEGSPQAQTPGSYHSGPGESAELYMCLAGSGPEFLPVQKLREQF